MDCTKKNSSFYRRGVFLFLRYNLLPFTDTNSVICKIYVVGADAHIRPRVDVGIDPYEKRRKIYYESNRNCS